jgi:putative ABC transport system ATP-binding protein
VLRAVLGTVQSVTCAAVVHHGVKTYGKGLTTVRALDDVSLEVASARFTAVMGPSGSGKSTLMHCLAGLDTLTSGRVEVAGVDLGALSEHQRTLLRRDRLGFVFQSFNLIPTLSAAENITLPLSLAGRSVDPVWFDELVGLVGLSDRLRHRPAELSGGQAQRVAVARALVAHPELVIADEPTGNLDSKAAAEILTFLRRAADDFGRSVVMVTHDPVAASYAHQVEFLTDGRHVHTLDKPTAETVLDAMKSLG